MKSHHAWGIPTALHNHKKDNPPSDVSHRLCRVSRIIKVVNPNKWLNNEKAAWGSSVYGAVMLLHNSTGGRMIPSSYNQYAPAKAIHTANAIETRKTSLMVPTRKKNSSRNFARFSFFFRFHFFFRKRWQKGKERKVQKRRVQSKEIINNY